MALYGIGWAVSFDAGLRVYGAKLSLWCFYRFYAGSFFLRQNPMALQVLRAYGLWTLAIIVSDLVNGTALFDSLRHLATPLIGSAGVIFVGASLIRLPSSLVTFFVGIGISKALLGEPAYGDTFAEYSMSWASVQQNSNFFKVRFEPFLSPLAVCLAIGLGSISQVYAAIWLGLTSIVYFSMDARSAGVAMFLAGLATIFIHWGFRPRAQQLLLGGILSLALSYGAYATYVTYSLSTDNLGQNARQLQAIGNPYNPISLLAIGRSEWLVMPKAVMERPLFGWGSWARDENNRFNYMRIERIGSIDYGTIDHSIMDLYIPAHSVVGSAWVWSGILGFVAMIWLLKSTLIMAWRLPSLRSPLLPAVAYLTIVMFWHFCFSPPQSVRLFFPISLGALIVLSGQAMVERMKHLYLRATLIPGPVKP